MHVISIINHMVLQSIRQLCPPHLHFSNNPSLLGLLRSLHTSEQLHTVAIKNPKQTCHKTPFYFPNVILPLKITLTWSSIFNLELPAIFCLGSGTGWWLLSLNPWRWRWEPGSPNTHKFYLSKHAANSCFQILFTRKLPELQMKPLCFTRQFLVIFQIF